MTFVQVLKLDVEGIIFSSMYCISNGNTLITLKSNRLYIRKLIVEKKMIECPFGSAIRTEVLRLNGELSKTCLLNDGYYPFNAYAYAIQWSDWWFVLNDERMGSCNAFQLRTSAMPMCEIVMAEMNDKYIYMKSYKKLVMEQEERRCVSKLQPCYKTQPCK